MSPRRPLNWLWIDPDAHVGDKHAIQDLSDEEVKRDWGLPDPPGITVLVHTPLLRIEALNGKVAAVYIHKSLIEEKK